MFKIKNNMRKIMQLDENFSIEEGSHSYELVFKGKRDVKEVINKKPTGKTVKKEVTDRWYLPSINKILRTYLKVSLNYGNTPINGVKELIEYYEKIEQNINKTKDKIYNVN